MMHNTHFCHSVHFTSVALTAAVWGTCLSMWAGPCTWELSQFCLILILSVIFVEDAFQIIFFPNRENDGQRSNSDIWWHLTHTLSLELEFIDSISVVGWLQLWRTWCFTFLAISTGCMYRTRQPVSYKVLDLKWAIYQKKCWFGTRKEEGIRRQR